MGSDQFLRIRIEGFRGSEVNSSVFELSEDHDLPMKDSTLKRLTCNLVNKAIDKGAEEIIIYLVSMKRLKPR